MTRVATIPLQRTMSEAMQKAQQSLATTQLRLSTGKKAVDFADLGTEAVRNLSAHSMLARQQAQSTVAKRVDTTLSLYSGHVEGIRTAIGDLRQHIQTVIGTGDAAGLQEAIETAFDQFRTSLNASEGGLPLFSGAQTSNPFAPDKLADAATVPTDDAFRDDQVLASARVAEGVDMAYGLSASAIGKNIYEAFRTLAQAGTIGLNPTSSQLTALTQAVSFLNTGIDDVDSANADNGRRQSQIESLVSRGQQRALLLEGVIEENEDADLGQVAVDLAQQKTVLQASYSVFSQLSGLSLVNFLR